MATNINITVGDDDLVARARQEMAAHRTGSNIAQGRTKAGEKGKAERARRLAIQGRDGEGRTIPTAPFTPPRRDDAITGSLAPSFTYGEGYLTVTRGTNDVAILKVRSGNKDVVVEKQLTGSEIPVGFRDRAGADRLPELISEEPANFFGPYQYEYTAESDPVFYEEGGVTTQYIKEFTQTKKSKGHTGLAKNQLGEIVFYTPPTGDSVYGEHGANSGGWTYFDSAYSSQTLVLPLSNKAAIIAYVETRQSYKTYAITEETRVARINNESPPLSYFISHSFESSVKETVSIKNTALAAFYVGRSTVREIEFPPALLSAMRSSFYYREINYVTEPLTKSVASSAYTFWGEEPQYVNVRGNWFVSRPSIPEDPFSDYTQFLYKTWGEARPLYAVEPSFWSPGVFSALKEGVPGTTPPGSYTAIRSLLPSPAKNIRWHRLEELSDKTEIQEYRAPLPTLYNDSFNEDKFRKVSTFNYEPQPQETYYRWTDWEAPSYCRKQALELGFTPADLKP